MQITQRGPFLEAHGVSVDDISQVNVILVKEYVGLFSSFLDPARPDPLYVYNGPDPTRGLNELFDPTRHAFITH